MLELYVNFFTSSLDTDEHEKLEMHTDLLYSVLAEIELYDCTRSEKAEKWELLRSKTCNVSFNADACSNFFPRTCCAEHKKKHDKRRPRLFKEGAEKAPPTRNSVLG